MIICPNCGRENESHYKFCLGCGTELSLDDEAPAATALPIAAPTPVRSSFRSTPPVSAPPPRFEPSFPSSAPGAHDETIDRPVDGDDDDDDQEVSIDSAPPSEPFDDGGMRATILSAAVPQFEDAIAPESTLDAVGTVDEEPELPFDAPSGQTPAPLSAQGALANLDASESIEEPIELPVELPVDRPSTDGPAAVPEPTEIGQASPAPVSRAFVPSRPPAGASRDCPSCGAVVPDGFKFCGVCGSRYEESPVAQAAPVVSVSTEGAAILVMVHPDGTDGDSFELGAGETVIGRARPEPLFANDPFLSPEHATLYFSKGQLFVRDEASLNGIFLRIKAEVELFHCDMFRVGQQLLRFEEMSQVRPVVPGAGDGTTVMGSPVRGCWGRLGSIVGIDTAANVWPLRKGEIQFGRERGDVRFPEDGFVSGSHAKLSAREGRYFLADLDSTNGTYLRIKGEGLLASGDLLLLGQQLFRVKL